MRFIVAAEVGEPIALSECLDGIQATVIEDIDLEVGILELLDVFVGVLEYFERFVAARKVDIDERKLVGRV